jgi:hypothetical protein
MIRYSVLVRVCGIFIYLIFLDATGLLFIVTTLASGSGTTKWGSRISTAVIDTLTCYFFITIPFTGMAYLIF